MWYFFRKNLLRIFFRYFKISVTNNMLQKVIHIYVSIREHYKCRFFLFPTKKKRNKKYINYEKQNKSINLLLKRFLGSLNFHVPIADLRKLY